MIVRTVPSLFTSWLRDAALKSNIVIISVVKSITTKPINSTTTVNWIHSFKKLRPRLKGSVVDK
jgi:hypothetical protein